MVNGQNSILDKKVSLLAGQVMLKAALTSISTQTGCVFSYDPTKIKDSQKITVSKKGTQSLRKTLLEILPKNILFTVNGKYIVLQAGRGKTADKPVTNPSNATKTMHANRCKGTIDDNPNNQRLVLPPLAGNTETGAPIRTGVVEIKPGNDSLNTKQERIIIQPADSTKSSILVPDTQSKRRVLTNETRSIVSLPDTTNHPSLAPLPLKEKSGLGYFLNRNGYLETGVSLNKRLGALSVHAGLYNIYSIFSMGSDYHNSYLFGIGIGARVKLDPHFSLNFDLLKNSLVAGKSYLLNVRASNTQFSPVLNYTLLSSFKLFAGPTLNLIKSSYESGISSTDLGVLVGIGFSAGLKIDLKSLLSTRVI